MKTAEILKKLLWFSNPLARKENGASTVHASKWTKWHKSALQDAESNVSEKVAFRIFATLRTEIIWSLLAIILHSLAGFGAALTLKILLTQLLIETSSLQSNITIGALCILLTYISWLSLNHTFYLAELIGIGGRTYAELRLVFRKNIFGKTAEPLNIMTLFDRETTRIETFWTGLVTLILAFFTIVYTSVFFFLTLGISALAALLTIAISSLVVFFIAKKLNSAFDLLSKNSSQRIEIGMFSINNHLQVWLRNWHNKIAESYTRKRESESYSLKKAARLVAAVSLVSTMSPMLALLSTAFIQLILQGSIDVPSILSAIALLGGLRSVANNMPEIVQNLSKGIVGHRNIESHLKIDQTSSLIIDDISVPNTNARHIAIIGEAGSGKSTFLRAFTRKINSSNTLIIYVPDEPWIFEGSFQDNLSLYSQNFTDKEAFDAIEWSRLPVEFKYQFMAEKENNKREKLTLSRGQGKRLELARAILAKPDWIFIDKPTSGLDNELSNGLLLALLRGPWKDINVVFISDKQQEISAAQEVFTIVKSSVVKIHKNKRWDTIAKENTFNNDKFIDESYSDDLKNQSIDKTVNKKFIYESVKNFGILKLVMFATLVFSFKEALGIYGDYIITNDKMSADLEISLLLLVCIIVLSSFLSIVGSLVTVKRTIDAASEHCINYFKSLLNPSLDQKVRNEIERDNKNKLTWDQRRTDETLPVLMLETINAATLLLIVTSFVIINNIYIFIPLLAIFISYGYEIRTKSPQLQHVNFREIDSTSILFSRIESIVHSGNRFDNSAGKKNLYQWLKPKLQSRTYASLDNAGVRRWYSFKLDMNGVLFLSFIILSAIYIHAGNTISTGNVLSLSLSYNIIAIFGRLGRCLIELRQIMDSADRLVVSNNDKNQSNEIDINKVTGENLSLVSFKDVTYSYNNSHENGKRRKDILNDFNDSFYATDVVVITGQSGIGKSTFANLLIGYLKPNKGHVITLGHTLSYIELKHEKHIQLLTSEPVFSPGTLAEHFNAPSEEEFLGIVHYVNCDNIIAKLTEGLGQKINWNGKINLSKSELQKLAILDVLLNKPSIAILDEATSELTEKEELIFVSKITSYLPETLFIIITHNPLLSSLGTRNFEFDLEGKFIEI